MMRATRLIVVGVGVMIAMSGQPRAAMMTFEIKDIGAFDPYTTNNVGQGYSGTGFVGLYETTFAHLFGLETANYSKTALQVDISSLAGATINNAVLTFMLLDGSNNFQNITATSFTAAGSLSHYWTPPDVLGSSLYSINGQAVNALDVTGFLQERLGSNADWLGLHLQGSSEYQWTYTGGGYDADRAEVRLNVDYEPSAVPEPASMALFGIGGLGLLAVRRRKSVRKEMSA